MQSQIGRHAWSLLGILLLCALAGCASDTYRYETVLHSEGFVDRAIYQPDLKDQSAWNFVTGAAKISHDEWDSSIFELPAAVQDDDHPYLAAWGTFRSVEAIPDHFEIKSPDESRSSTLSRRYAQTDYGFVVEHRWSETLTDIVDHDDMHQAVSELMELLISLGEEIFEEALGDEYDTSEFIAWLKTEGTPWMVELFDLYWDVSTRDLDSDQFEEELMRVVAANCSRHGLNLVDENGRPAGPETEKLAVNFLEAKLRGLVRNANGEAMDSEKTRVMLAGLGLRSAGDKKIEARAQELKQIARRVVEERFGSMQAFEAVWSSLLARIVGLYGLGGSMKEFRFSLEVPGMIVESNGVQQSDNAVEWQFDGRAAFPHGYAMNCRSLEATDEALDELLPNNLLVTRKALLAYVKLAQADEELKDLLIVCRDAMSLAPFDALLHELQLDPLTDTERLNRLLEIRELLLLGE